jgi:spore coat protein A, manganese oxidase
MNMNRRKAIQMGLAAGGMLLSPLSFSGRAEALPPLSPRIKRFCTPLPIFEPLSPNHTDSDTDYYEIKIQQAVKEIPVELQDGGPLTLKMDIWGYNGITPGPMIRQQGGPRNQGGRYSVVRFINELPESTDDTTQRNAAVIHLHGMNALPCFDGYAKDFIRPCEYKDYEYPNDAGGILWYHDHTLHRTSQNVYKGLAGMYVVEEEAERKLNLPRGKNDEYDIPLILQDRRFEQNGQSYRFDDNGQRSLYGDLIMVNGAPWPKLTVERRKYRFRLLNASVSRNYLLALSSIDRDAVLDKQGCEQREGLDGAPYSGLIDQLIVIGNDEGLLNRPVIVKAPQTLNMGIAERYDVVIDFSKYNPGDHVFLRNVGFAGTIDNDRRTHTIMRFDVVEGGQDESEIPNILNPEEFLPFDKLKNQVSQIRTFRFERNQGLWKINNQTWNEAAFIATPGHEAIEIWDFINPGSGWVHPVHPHLIRFRILSRNGRAPKPYEQGPKDVVMVGEFERVRVLARFCPHEGIYMMHCHNLVHEDHDMMTQFKVGTQGESPLSKPAKSCKELKPMNPPAKILGDCPPLEFA